MHYSLRSQKLVQRKVEIENLSPLVWYFGFRGYKVSTLENKGHVTDVTSDVTGEKCRKKKREKPT